MLTRIAIPFLAFALLGCQESPTQPAPESPPTKASEPTATRAILAAEVHHAVCGCTLDDVGHCGNYVDIDGSFVKLRWPELGAMEYCKLGKKGAQVEITGEMTDGEFVASTYRLVD